MRSFINRYATRLGSLGFVTNSFVLIFSMLIVASSVFSQQDPQFSQNSFLKLPVNPGYAGMMGAFYATSVYRTQWVNFPGAPKTFLFCADAPLKLSNDSTGLARDGVGITFVDDRLGNFHFTNARASYSYHRPVGNVGLFGIGLEAGIIHLDSKAFDTIVPAFSGTTYDLGLGAYYHMTQCYVGFSVAHLPGNMEKMGASPFDYRVARHYYLMAGYTFFLSSRINAEPSVFVKSDAAVTTFDVNLKMIWNNFLWIGSSYRLQDAVVLMAGGTFQLFRASSLVRIGYAYDIGISDLRAYHDNTHEILISYSLKLK